MTYKEARVYLDRVSKYGSVLGLGAIRKLLCELGNPETDLKFIHIAGTNGKGSVLAYTSTILSEAGYRVGRYISPTVVSYLERIQVDGRWISEDTFAGLTNMVQNAIARIEAAGDASPTVFEVETAIAFLYFREMNCDLVVLECGLGGAEDATNVIEQTLLAVFTPISRDHLGILGSTLEEIASVKAGIIKPGCTVVTAPQEPEVLQILKKQAGQFQCPLAAANRQDTELIEEAYDGQTVSYKDWKNLYCPLAGRYQLDNVITALEALRMLGTLGYPVSPDALRKGLSKTVWPGRLTCLTRNPLFLIDGAHNEAAAKKLRESLEAYFPGRRFIYIMGVFKDKEYEKIAGIMAPLARSVHTVSLPDTARTLPAEELAGVMKRYCAAEDPIPAQNCMGSAIQDTNVPVRAEASIEIAVKHAFAEANKTDIILAFVSLSYLVVVMRIHEDIRTQYINEI